MRFVATKIRSFRDLDLKESCMMFLIVATCLLWLIILKIMRFAESITFIDDCYQFYLLWVILPRMATKNYQSKKYYFSFKGAFSGLRQFLATENPLKVIKNAFYITLKAFFIFKIFKFLSWYFGHVSKRLD